MEKIVLDHGSGGKAYFRLISDLLVPSFDNPILARLDDSAVLDVGKNRLAFSTDTYVVDPIFFPGGNIGDLAVNGTVNDLAMSGAVPRYLSLGLILEEGFPTDDLEKILRTMKNAAAKADVLIVTGDTKVVPRKAADKIYINTSGIGIIPDGLNISGHNARCGDKIIISGTIAEHGIIILIQREKIEFESEITSDTAPLNSMVQRIIQASDGIHALRDPTRGGVGTTLNEIAIQSNIGIDIYEESIPVKEEVAAVCRLLGIDPLYVANEGRLIAFVSPDHVEKVLDAIRRCEHGKDAAIIGEVTSGHAGKVRMKTSIGGSRIVDMLTGEQLPRIC